MLPPHVSRLIAQVVERNRQKETAQCEYPVGSGSETTWFAARLTPMLLDNQYAGSFVEVRDISERKRKEKEEETRRLNLELQQRVAGLEAAFKELESFSYSVEHPAGGAQPSTVSSALVPPDEYLSELSGEAQQQLARARANAQQMQRMIDDLLMLSRLSNQPLNVQTVKPEPLVRAALEDLRAEQQGRKIDITITDLPQCQADPVLLQQAFRNLLANAIKFTRTRERAAIEVGAIADAGELVCFVRDNGVGFDMQQADKLFGVFQRLHPNGDYEGKGVGLAIVQRIIQRHGGRVWAEAEPDKGATFYFALKS